MAHPPFDDPDFQEAARLADKLAGVLPRDATRETVDAYASALTLLRQHRGSSLWFQVSHGFASHLMEVAGGDPVANLRLARDVYSDMLRQAELEERLGRRFDDWFLAVMGLVNTVRFDATAGADQIAGAAARMDGVVTRARSDGAPAQLAQALALCADLHSRNPQGDMQREQERALGLQHEALGLFTDLEDSQRQAHAHYNLGAMYANRRSGMRSQNIDSAIHHLYEALRLRPAEQDPLGRARVLRSLAVLLPDWSEPASRAEAEALAQHAADESNRLEARHGRQPAHDDLLLLLRRNQSALRADLSALYQIPRNEWRDLLKDQVEFHQQILARLDRDTMTDTWAEWSAGLGRLLGRLAHAGASEAELQLAWQSYQQAAESLHGSNSLGLFRDVMASWGEFNHERGWFDASYETHNAAAEANVRLLAAITDPHHRLAEISRTRGCGLFGAYAAVRRNQPADAARLAEIECNRGIGDLLSARAAMRVAAPERAAELVRTFDHMRDLQAGLDALTRQSPDAEMAQVRSRLADSIGINPEILQLRRTDDQAHQADDQADEREALRSQLQAAARHLRDQVAAEADQRAIWDADRIEETAASAGCVLMYLMATAHGGAAVLVLPEGGVHGLALPDLTSDLTRDLVQGGKRVVGLQDALNSDLETFDACLTRINAALGWALVAPVSAELEALGATAPVAVVGLGRLARLPLHMVFDEFRTVSIAPSAKALAAVAGTAREMFRGSVLGVADPRHEQVEPLRFALAECRWLEHLRGNGRTRLLEGEAARFESVQRDAGDATLLHLACHGQFRPSDPLQSRLLLAGDRDLQVGDWYFGVIDVGKARLVSLSACDSAAVEHYQASDESLGFPASLMLAGVPGVLGANWPVDDAAAMLFMTEFYRLLAQRPQAMGLAEAARCSRQWLRHAPAPQLRERLAAVRAVLHTTDTTATRALDDLDRYLGSLDAAVTPYRAPSDWGAFFLTGT